MFCRARRSDCSCPAAAVARAHGNGQGPACEDTIQPLCPSIAGVKGPSHTRGQSLAEYALIVALIVIVALVALTLFGTQINDILSIVRNQISGGN